MRFTTVAVLVISSVVCCNAQKHVATNLLKRITTLNNATGTARFLQLDSAYVMVRLRPDHALYPAISPHFVRAVGKDLVIAKATEAHLLGSVEIIAVNHLWKVSQNLLSLQFKRSDSYVIECDNPQDLIRKLKHFGLNVRAHGRFLMVQGNIESVLSLLLTSPDVTYLGQESFAPKEEGRVLDLYHGPNKINKLHHHHPELNGEGIVISIKERQFNPADIDLKGRSLPSMSADQDTSNHATEMATIVAGAGNSFITGKGVLSHSKLTTSSFANLFPDNPSHYSSTNAYLQNHAYGTVVENFYGALANAYDVAANENPKLLHVFSSGNAGTAMASSGKYVNTPGYSNLTGNSKMAKNVLVVGSVDTTGHAISFSSRGPAHDGRIKPEIVAYSTAGTSNSAAMVAGVAGALQQTYKRMTGNYPDAALLKAVLINSADDVGAPGIDFITGFGNLNAYRSVKTILENRFFEGVISQGQIKTFDVLIPENVRNLKVTLVWNDPAAPVNSSSALVNNLDLDLMSSGEIFQPWILDSSPTSEALAAPPKRGTDNINSIEQVSDDRPSPQTYHIEVRGISVTSTQKFFVVYQWDNDGSFTWNYPTGSDNFPYNGETGTYFYWHSTLAETKGDLEVTVNDGVTWTPVAADLDLSKGYYRWENPFSTNASARARMVVGSSRFETEDFTISRTLLPAVAFNCADSVLLQWNRMPEVSAYAVRQLNGNYTSPYVTTADTAVIIKKTNAAEYYAVQPMLVNGKLLLRSPAINTNTYGAGCFVSTFVDEAVGQEGILLRLELGTTYGIAAVVLEHAAQGSDEFNAIAAIEDPSSTVIRHLHTDAVQGLNRYRARITLVNGQVIFSDVIQSYFLTQIPFVVFPNPVQESQSLNVFSGKFEPVEFTFQLFRTDGTWMRSAEIRSDRESISMQGLSPGLYVYRIEGSAGRFSGKIIIK